MSPIGSIFWGFRCHILVISVIFMLNFCSSVTFCTFFHVKISKVHYLSLKFLVISKVPFLSLFSLKCHGTPDLGLWHTSVPWHTGWQPMGWRPYLTWKIFLMKLLFGGKIGFLCILLQFSQRLCDFSWQYWVHIQRY